MNGRDGDALTRLGVQCPATTRDTSLAAQEAIQNAKTELQRKVYEYIFTCGEDGATDEEIQMGTGMNGNSERPRRQELEKLGVIFNTGLTRRTVRGRPAVIWRIRRRDDGTVPVRLRNQDGSISRVNRG